MADGDGATDVLDLSGNGKGVALNVSPRRAASAISSSGLPFAVSSDYYQATDANYGVSLQRAIDALKLSAFNNNGNTYKGSSRLIVPAGNFAMSTFPLSISHTIRIEGESSGQAGGYATRLKWDAMAHSAIRLYRYNTEGDNHTISSPTHFGADGSQIRGLQLEGSAVGGNADYHGIESHVRCLIEDCAISNFRGDGINYLASAGAGAGGIEGNANCFHVVRCVISFCRNGMSMAGADVNSGKIDIVDCSANRLWGFDDSSFLGNKLDTCHAAGNGTGALGGPYRTTNDNALTLIDDCYSEGGQNPSLFTKPTIILGGQHGAGVIGGTYFSPGTSGFRLYPGNDVFNVLSSASGNVFVAITGNAGYGTLTLGDGRGGQVQGSPGYLLLNTATGAIIRLDVDGTAIADVTAGGLEIKSGKTINFGGITNAANDAAAAAAGVPLGSMYRNGSQLLVRTV